MLILGFGGIKIHEEENREIGIDYKRTTLKGINEIIKDVRYPNLFIDDFC
jgi:hypothetical protein